MDGRKIRKSLMKEVAFAAAAAVLVAVSPLTPGDWLRSGAAGLLVFGGVLAYRWHARAGAPAEPEEAGLRLHVPLSMGGALLLMAVVFVPISRWLYAEWTISVWQNAHGIFIPVLMVYLMHGILKRDTDETDAASPWGFAFLVPGLLLIVADAGIRTQYLSAVGLVLCLPGLALLMFGARRARKLALPLFIGVFMIPIPATAATHLVLKRITAAAVEPLLAEMGIPVVREGTILVLPNATFVVADACSGFSALYAGVGVSLLLAVYARSHVRKVLLLLAAWPLAILSNVARVLFLVAASNHSGLWLLDSPLHTASGIATFWAVLGGLFLLSDREALRTATG